MARRTSLRLTTPSGPVGWMLARSRPASLAILRTSGEITATRPGRAGAWALPSGGLARPAGPARPPGPGGCRLAARLRPAARGGGATGAAAPSRRGGGGAVADQHAAACLVAASPRYADRRRARAGRRRRARGSRLVGGGGDGDKRLPDGEGLARLRVQLGDDARVRDGDFHHRLGGLHLRDDLVDRHVVADADAPGDDLGVVEALAQVGQQEVRHRRRPPIAGARWRPGCGRCSAGGTAPGAAADRGCPGR